MYRLVESMTVENNGRDSVGRGPEWVP